MIFLTGDVHNSVLTQDIEHAQVDEPTAALKYAQMAADLGVKVTFFATGTVVRDRTKDFQSMLTLGNVELGGHGWDAFRWPRQRTALWCAFGSRFGPKWFQWLEIDRTMKAFQSGLGITPVAWRGHAYYTDQNTYPLLSASGIRLVSDRNVAAPFSGKAWAHQEIAEIRPSLWSLPINTTPDHDGFAHGGVTQDAVDTAMRKRTMMDRPEGDIGSLRRGQIAGYLRRAIQPFSAIDVMPWSGDILYQNTRMELATPESWERRLMYQIEERVAAVGFATLLLHPVCMWTLDNFVTLKRILAFCSRFPTDVTTAALDRIRRTAPSRHVDVDDPTPFGSPSMMDK